MNAVASTEVDPIHTRDGASNSAVAASEALSPAQLQVMAEAKQRRRKIDRAANVAAVGGWITAVLACLSAPFALIHWESIVAVVVLGLVAYHEFKGRRMLKALDPTAPRVLGFNQVGFAIAIIAYAVWKLFGALTGEGYYAQAIAAEPMLADALAPIEDLMKSLELVVYGTLIVGTIFFQGGTAWYYFSRAKHVRAYVASTPRWVIDLLARV